MGSNFILEKNEKFAILGNINQPNFRFKISTQDLDTVLKHNWSLHYSGYVRTRIGTLSTVKLHNFMADLMFKDFSLEKGLVVDHINRDKTDNSRENLRLVPYRINCLNNSLVLSKINKNKYLGVFKSPKQKVYWTRFNDKVNNFKVKKNFYSEKLAALYYDWLILNFYKHSKCLSLHLQYTNIGFGLITDYDFESLSKLSEKDFSILDSRPYSSKYQGITFTNGKFRVRIHKTVGKKSVLVYSAFFDSEEDALSAREEFYDIHPECVTSRTIRYKDE